MPTNTLEARVHQFMSLELPGQPQAMHMGTFSLVGDLWAEVKRLREAANNFEEYRRDPPQVRGAMEDPRDPPRAKGSME